MVVDLEDQGVVIGGSQKAGGHPGVTVEEPGQRVEEVGGELVGSNRTVGDTGSGDASVLDAVGLEGISNRCHRLSWRQLHIGSDLDPQKQVLIKRACSKTGERYGKGSVPDHDRIERLLKLDIAS